MAPKRSRTSTNHNIHVDENIVTIDPPNDRSTNPNGKRPRSTSSNLPDQSNNHSNHHSNGSSNHQSIEQREAELVTRENMLDARESALAAKEVAFRKKDRDLDRSAHEFEMKRLSLLTEIEQMKASQTRQQSEILLSLAQLTTKKAEMERMQRDLLVEQAQFDLRVAEDLRENAQLARDVAGRLRQSAESAQQQLDIVKATPAAVAHSRVQMPLPPVPVTHSQSSRPAADVVPSRTNNNSTRLPVLPPSTPTQPTIDAPTHAAAPSHPQSRAATVPVEPSVTRSVSANSTSPSLHRTKNAVFSSESPRLLQSVERNPVVDVMDLSEESSDANTAPSPTMPTLEAVPEKIPTTQQLVADKHVIQPRIASQLPDIRPAQQQSAQPPPAAAPVTVVAPAVVETSMPIQPFVNPILVQPVDIHMDQAVAQLVEPTSSQQPLPSLPPITPDQPLSVPPSSVSAPPSQSLTFAAPAKPAIDDLEVALEAVKTQSDVPLMLVKNLANMYKLAAVEPPKWETLCRREVWQYLLEVMKSHPSQAMIWAECIRLLSEIAHVASPADFQIMLDAGLHTMVVTTVKDHPTNVECQRCACIILDMQFATLSDSARGTFAKSLVVEGCVPILVEDVRRCMKAPIAQAAIVEVLADIVVTQIIQPIAQTTVIKLLTEAIKKHRYSRELNQAGCRLLLSMLSQDTQLVTQFVVADGVKTVLGSLRSHVSEAKVMENALHIFCIVASSNDENARRTLVNSHRSGLVACIIKIMNRHELDSAIQRYSCELIAQIAADNDAVKRDVGAASGVTVIQAAVGRKEWQEQRELQDWGKRALQIVRPISP